MPKVWLNIYGLAYNNKTVICYMLFFSLQFIMCLKYLLDTIFRTIIDNQDNVVSTAISNKTRRDRPR